MPIGVAATPPPRVFRDFLRYLISSTTFVYLFLRLKDVIWCVTSTGTYLDDNSINLYVDCIFKDITTRNVYL